MVATHREIVLSVIINLCKWAYINNFPYLEFKAYLRYKVTGEVYAYAVVRELLGLHANSEEKSIRCKSSNSPNHITLFIGIEIVH